MSEKKHTPGPWKVGVDGIRGCVESPVGQVCASVRLATDAHLIAAAPEMLEALEEIDLLLDMGDDVHPNTAFTFDNPELINAAFAKARAAIKKARGEK